MWWWGWTGWGWLPGWLVPGPRWQPRSAWLSWPERWRGVSRCRGWCWLVLVASGPGVRWSRGRWRGGGRGVGWVRGGRGGDGWWWWGWVMGRAGAVGGVRGGGVGDLGGA